MVKSINKKKDISDTKIKENHENSQFYKFAFSSEFPNNISPSVYADMENEIILIPYVGDRIVLQDDVPGFEQLPILKELCGKLPFLFIRYKGQTPSEIPASAINSDLIQWREMRAIDLIENMQDISNPDKWVHLVWMHDDICSIAFHQNVIDRYNQLFNNKIADDSLLYENLNSEDFFEHTLDVEKVSHINHVLRNIHVINHMGAYGFVIDGESINIVMIEFADSLPWAIAQEVLKEIDFQIFDDLKDKKLIFGFKHKDINLDSRNIKYCDSDRAA